MDHRLAIFARKETLDAVYALRIETIKTLVFKIIGAQSAIGEQQWETG